MADLSSKQRGHLKPSQFGLPGTKSYPIPDKSHAANAKARASEEFHKGRLTRNEELTIDKRADAVLKR